VKKLRGLVLNLDVEAMERGRLTRGELQHIPCDCGHHSPVSLQRC